jgi:hypothetical protein
MEQSAAMLAIARELADTLMVFARLRRDDDKKRIAQLHTLSSAPPGDRS